jgi:hypothetical protein
MPAEPVTEQQIQAPEPMTTIINSVESQEPVRQHTTVFFLNKVNWSALTISLSTEARWPDDHRHQDARWRIRVDQLQLLWLQLLRVFGMLLIAHRRSAGRHGVDTHIKG